MQRLLLFCIILFPLLLGCYLDYFDLNWQLENLAAFIVFIPACYLILTIVLIIIKQISAAMMAAVLSVTSLVLFGTTPQFITSDGCDENYVSVMQYNTYYDNQQLGNFIDFVRERRSDILVLQEVSPQHGEQLKLLKDLYPYQYGGQRRVGYPSGQMILSRAPLYGMNTTTSISGHNIIQVVWRASNERDLFLIAAHPPSPRSEALWRERNEVIEDVVDMAQASPLDVTIVVGDFNLASTTERFDQLLPSFDKQPVASWPKFIKRWSIPFVPVVAIDHFWIRRVGGSQNTICFRDSLKQIQGSDHVPVETRFRL
ncbi:endonuclease/exonuclease/phosphatase family protein [Vibrio mediterranei]